jgi:hypothetical protein
MRFRASERAVVHGLAVYLEHAFWGWHTDCEYNRQGGRPDPKQAALGGEPPRNVVPDIVVHLRGPNGPNLLAVEVKPGTAAQPADREKLRRYVADHHYSFAALVTYDEGGNVAVERVEYVGP